MSAPVLWVWLEMFFTSEGTNSKTVNHLLSYLFQLNTLSKGTLVYDGDVKRKLGFGL